MSSLPRCRSATCWSSNETRRSYGEVATSHGRARELPHGYRTRAVPFNVNHHYTPGELRALLEMVGAEGVIYERRLGPLLAEALDGSHPLLIDIDDDSGVAPLAGSTNYESPVDQPDGVAVDPSQDLIRSAGAAA